MSTLTEIEIAADSLPIEQKEELLRFLAMRLDEERPRARQASGKASEWLRTAKGSVRAATGESADDLRMAYYTAKYGVRE